MKVFLVWTGQYSDASVVGVYSTLALAEAAAKLYDGGHVDEPDGFEVDAGAPMVRTGVGRWCISMCLSDDDGGLTRADREGVGTGEPPRVDAYTERVWQKTGGQYVGVPSLRINCDARDKDHAVKIAGDERAKYLALASPRAQLQQMPD